MYLGCVCVCVCVCRIEIPYFKIHIKTNKTRQNDNRISLVVQWLRLHMFTAVGTGLMSGWGQFSMSWSAAKKIPQRKQIIGRQDKIGGC